MKKLLIILACICLLGACAVKKNNAPISPLAIEGEWILQTLQGTNVADLQRPITIHFIEAEKRVNGYAGCNQYFSSYTRTGFSIRFHALGRTKMYCDKTMELEEKFIMALVDVESFKSEGDILIFMKDETVLLEFIQ